MFRLALGGVLVALLPFFPPADPKASCCAPDSGTKASESSALDIVKSWVGTWAELDAEDQPTGKVVSKFSVTAGGSAVLEILFPGTKEEMVSVYSIDDGKLVMDHYCLYGNQPRYEGKVSEDGKTIEWRCAGGGNLKDHSRAHMHEGVTKILSADRMEGDWTALENGATIMREQFHLGRKSTGVR